MKQLHGRPRVTPAAGLPPVAPSADTRGRARTVRASALRSTMVPGMSAAYALATWGAPHRAAMVLIAVAMLALAGVTYRHAAAIARSAARPLVQGAGLVITVLGGAVLSLLDGGVAGPLGALVPFSLVYLAIMTPPRVFAGTAALGVAAYWAVAAAGPPSPPGYPLVYTLGMGGVAYLCLRHAGALASLRRRLADVSRIDPLTRCLNRRGFDERLAQELAEAARTGDPVTLVLIDLDHFKEVNDVYGHRAGDEVLSWTGRALAAVLRTHDAVGRLGGDEFGAVLGNTGTQGAAVVAGRLRTALDDAAPASLGYATYPTEATTAEQLKHLADSRVYADKVARDRHGPSAEAVAVAVAGTAGSARTTARVSRRERRRRSIADMGWVAAANCAVGLLYGAFLAGGTPGGRHIALLCLLGVGAGLAMVAAAGTLSRSVSARSLMMVSAAGLFSLAVEVGVLDGGVHSAMGLAMLAPMPLVALGAPLRLATPLLAVASLCYVAVGAVVGPANAWYVVMQLAGILSVSAGCAVQGRAAARQRRLLTRLSVVDVLTDCLNRRGFSERFAAELSHAHRTDRALSLLVLDLDGFKQVNDSRGHAAGDELLRWVAATLKAGLHPHDVVGRLGGDEFVVLLTSVSVADSGAAAERLRAALAERTPASLGLATLEQDGTFDALYARADARLYADKAERRARRPR
jgi:diguanylate cyclase (GGDEF)-like protein